MNLRDWVVTLVRPGGVVLSTTPWALLIGAFGLLAWLFHEQWGWRIPGEVLSLVLIFLAFLLFTIISSSAQIFRDGRQFLGGITNASVDLARQIVSFVPEETGEWNRLGSWLILFGKLVRYDLGQRGSWRGIEEILTQEELDVLSRKAWKERAHTVIAWISVRLSQLETEGVLTQNQRFQMDPNLMALTNGLGACRRVQKAQLPVDFAKLAELAIVLFSVTLPFVIVEEVGIWLPLVMTAVGYLLVGLLQLDSQTRDPYGTDPNDLNMDEFERGLVQGVQAMLGAKFPESEPKQTAT